MNKDKKIEILLKIIDRDSCMDVKCPSCPLYIKHLGCSVTNVADSELVNTARKTIREML